MKDFSCRLGKIKLVNEKRLSYIEVDTPRVRICLFPELSLQKEKKTTTPPTRGSLCEKR